MLSYDLLVLIVIGHKYPLINKKLNAELVVKLQHTTNYKYNGCPGLS